MHSSSGRSFSGDRSTKARKPYCAPKFRITPPEQAEAELKDIRTAGRPRGRGAAEVAGR